MLKRKIAGAAVASSNTFPARTCIDPTAFPDIVDAIVDFSDNETRLALWGTSKALHAHLCSRLYRKIVHYCGGYGPRKGATFPQLCKGPLAFLEVRHNIQSHCRTIDLITNCTVSPAVRTVRIAKSGGHPVTLRTWHTTDLSPFSKLSITSLSSNVPTTLILKGYCVPLSLDLWLAKFGFLDSNLPHGIKRVVVNISYTWADQLFASTVDLRSLPSSVEEVVFHFKNVGSGERPRCLVARRGSGLGDGGINDDDESTDTGGEGSSDDDGDHDSESGDDSDSTDSESDSSSDSDSEGIMFFGCKLLKTVSNSFPVPIVDGDIMHFHLIPLPEPQGFNMFESIAQMYARSLRNRKFRPLKLTLVGLDEFDKARDDDAAGDAAFDAIVDEMNWGITPSRELWAHSHYLPVATSFIASTLDLIPEEERTAVKGNMKLLPSDEYVAQLDKLRREEEDWWPENEQGERLC